MLHNSVVEYSLNNYSLWTTLPSNSQMKKIYLNSTNVFYYEDNKLINLITHEIFDSYLELNEIISISSTIIINEEYNDKVIHNEYDIQNAYYFKNFMMPDVYNTDGTCVLVSLAILFGYYDTFYNGNIVPDIIAYEGNSYETTIKKEINQPYINNKPSILDDTLTGPSIKFHEYLNELSKDTFGEDTTGLTINQAKQLAEKYFGENNISNINANYDYVNIIGKLNNNIPVILGFFNYTYYYNLCDGKAEKNSVSLGMHSAVVYGYQQTSIGTFFHAHVGYMPKTFSDGMNDYHNDVYINASLNSSYLSFEYTGEHVHSDNYKFSNGIVNFTICPCEDFETYFTYSSCTDEKDYFILTLDNKITVNSAHKYEIYQVFDESNHYAFCLQYDNCGKKEIQPHDYSLIGYTDDQKHYTKCRDCGYTKYEEHQNIYTINDDSTHTTNCSICASEICKNNHTLSYEYETPFVHKIKCQCGYTLSNEHNYDDSFNCLDCDYVHIQHVFEYVSCDENKHLNTCFCGYQIYENHQNEYTINDDLTHTTNCYYCGVELFEDNHNIYYDSLGSYSHNIICSCRYSNIEQHVYDYNMNCILCDYSHEEHTYTYSTYNSTQHICSCTCGYQIFSNHTFIKIGTNRSCIDCGYFVGNNISQNVTIETKICKEEEYEAY